MVYNFSFIQKYFQNKFSHFFFLDCVDIQFSSIDTNLIDMVWKEQPKRRFNPIITLDTSIAGKKISDAIEAIRKQMREKHSDLLVVTALDEVACK